MSSRYQRLPTSDTAADQHEEEEELSSENAYTRSTLAEFNRPAPPAWQRALVIFAIFFLGWGAWRVSQLGGDKPKIIYATRYSEEFKYRPAASPVITEYLKDGRIRLRGASPGGVGVRPGDLPETPAQKAAKEKKKKDEAAKKAKEAMRERRRKRKERQVEAMRVQAANRRENRDP